MDNTIKFNINHDVLIKLTSYGRKILLDKNEKYIEDNDGWSKWQLWDLMNIFGPYMKMRCNNPFDLSIKFEV